MKKFLALILALVLMLSLAACGGNDSKDKDEKEEKSSPLKIVRSISAGADHTVALKKDGTVVATGSSSLGQCDVENWEDIKVK